MSLAYLLWCQQELSALICMLSVCSHSKKSQTVGTPPGIISIFRNWCVCACVFEDCWHCVCMDGGHSSILSFFLAPSFSLPLHLPRSHSLFSVYLWGDLCWLKQFAPGTSFAVWKRSGTLLRAAENERGKTERALGGSHLQWRGGEEKCLMHHLALVTAQLKSIRMVIKEGQKTAKGRKLQYRETDEPAGGKVKRLLWLLY